MEAFILVKGRVGIKAPRLVTQVTENVIIDRYEDIIWEKTENGDILRDRIDKVIINNLPQTDRQYDVWMFDQVREV